MLFSVFSLEETISLKMSVRSLSLYEKCLLPVSICSSKTSLKLSVFVDDGNVTTDKKVGIERLYVAVTSTSYHP